MTIASAVAWAGVIIGLIAKWEMANHRFAAIKWLFLATAITGLWTLYLRDWPSTALNFATCVLMVRTLRVWRAAG